MKQLDVEQALRRALRPVDPGADFCDRVSARLAAPAPANNADAADPNTSQGRLWPSRFRQTFGRRPRWLPVAMAAAVMGAVGLAHWVQQQHQRQRSMEARAQLLQGLRIASNYLADARAAVIREEEFEP
jgi:hypothetical protein